MHLYRFHIKDYCAATAHLSNEEDLCYRRLLDMYYETERPIPLETEWVSRRLRVGSDLVMNVLKDFFIKQADGWHSTRCDGEILSYHEKLATARFNGKAGGRPKKTNPVSLGNQEITGLKANQEPRTKNQEPGTIDSDSKPIVASLPEKSADDPPSEKKGKAETFDPVAHLFRERVDTAVATDFVNLRKSKKAPLTKTAIQGIRSEAIKAGISLNDAIAECCTRGWQGFKADWYLRDHAPARASPGGRQTLHEQRDHTIAYLTGKIKHDQQPTANESRDITGEATVITGPGD